MRDFRPVSVRQRFLRWALRVTLAALVGSLVVGVSGISPAWAQMTVHCPTDNLQAAIDAASPGSTIQVSGTCQGTFTIPAKPLTLVGPATLNGRGSGPVLTVNAFGLDVGLKSLTIRNGHSGFAGGIFNGGAILSVFGSKVSDNSGANTGGINNDTGTVTLTDTIVSNNTGGGIENNSMSGSSFPSTLDLNHSTVTANSASAYGGIFNGGDGVLTVTDSRVIHNSASFGGGGIFNYHQLTVESSLITNNSASQHGAGFGGGIFSDLGQATIENSLISRNTAGVGGGIYSINDSTLVRNSRVSDNHSGNGGGIYTANATDTIETSSVAQNTAVSCCGGIENDGSLLSVTASWLGRNSASQGGGIGNIAGGQLTLMSTLVQNSNSASQGGGLFNGMNSEAKLDNSNLIRNSATNGGGIYNAGTLAVGNSFIFENTAVAQGGGIYNVGTAAVTNTRQVKNRPDNCFGC